MNDALPIVIVIVLSIIVGWCSRKLYEYVKLQNTKCGTIKLTPSDVPGICEAKFTIDDVTLLQNSKEVIFTVIHTQDIQ